MWNAITAKLYGKPAAEEAVKDFVAKPDDPLNQAAFAKELRKVLRAEPAFAAELARLLESAQRKAGDTISNTGSGAARVGEDFTTTTIRDFTLADVEQFLTHWHRLVAIGHMGPGESAERFAALHVDL